MSPARSVVDGIGPALDSALSSHGGRPVVQDGDTDPFSLSLGRSALVVRREPGGCTLDLIVERDDGPAVDQALVAWADRRGLTQATDQEAPSIIARDRHAAGRGRLGWNMEVGRKPSDPTLVRVEWRSRG